MTLLIKCLLHELVPPLSYFFLVLCSLAPHNLKRSLNVFWCQVLGLEAQVLVNNTGKSPLCLLCRVVSKIQFTTTCCQLVADLLATSWHAICRVANKSATSWQLSPSAGKLRGNVSNGFWAYSIAALQRMLLWCWMWLLLLLMLMQLMQLMMVAT